MIPLAKQLIETGLPTGDAAAVDTGSDPMARLDSYAESGDVHSELVDGFLHFYSQVMNGGVAQAIMNARGRANYLDREYDPMADYRAAMEVTESGGQACEAFHELLANHAGLYEEAAEEWTDLEWNHDSDEDAAGEWSDQVNADFDRFENWLYNEANYTALLQEVADIYAPL